MEKSCFRINVIQNGKISPHQNLLKQIFPVEMTKYTIYATTPLKNNSRNTKTSQHNYADWFFTMLVWLPGPDSNQRPSG